MAKEPYVTKITMRANRLRAYAEAVLGDSDLKVGPRAIALLLIETAEYFDNIQRRKKKRALPKNFTVHRAERR